MFTNISWANYLVVVTLLLAAYYLIIGTRFYSRELQHLLSGKRKPAMRPVQVKAPEALNHDHSAAFLDGGPEDFVSEDSPVQAADNTLQEIEQLADHLKEVLAEAASKRYGKEEFILLLQAVLKKYPALKDAPFRSAIHELIISECEKYGSITLSEEEIVLLWNEAV
ncbi:hypothetical protein GCM10023188_15730 [Pontibacter saemangeumensis]|uniref:Tellurite resistance protein TerB n=1 Tax=Pontibacter saemangeumensis TaxID=1084525 RepID=A0ABP8LI92_9BACT